MKELTTNEAAEVLGISPNTIRSAINKEQIIPHRFAYGRHFITIEEVERYRALHLGQKGRKRKEKGK